MRSPKFSSLSFSVVICLLYAGCSGLATRPARQMSYAETAFHAATLAQAESSQPNLYQLAKDALLRARAAYRLKNFKVARQMAILARHAAEDAEFKALQAAADGSLEDSGPGGNTR